MKIDRTKNAKNGIAVGLLLRLYQTVVPFLMRTAMIYFMGVEYLGLSSLFTSVLHILSLAELGVGNAMVFSMYRPIAQDDTRRICALMRLYRKYYRLIGLAILTMGMALLPFIPKLISGEVPGELNIYVLYLLNLLATVLTYWLFAYRGCLLQAHQRQDIVGAVTMLSSTVQYVLQFFVLFILRNYYAYVIVLLVGTVVNNVITAAVTNRIYPQYKPEGMLDKEEVRMINGKIKDLFSAKIGSVVVRHADTVVISSFLGLAMLAVYQNYYFIMNAVFAVIETIVSSITAGLGNSFVTETKEKNEADLLKLSFLYLWLIGICACCFLGMYQPFMEIWVGQYLMLGFGVVVSMTVYFYLYTLMRLLSIYKDAAGLWHEDRFRPLISAMVNLALNLLTVRAWGIYGVVLSTVVSTAIISVPWILHILYTKMFERKTMLRFMRQLLRFVILTVLSGGAVCIICWMIPFGSWVKLVCCAAVSALVPNMLFYALLKKSEQFKSSIYLLDRLTKGKLRLASRLIG